uniref:Archemetzincin n=1 Tax=Thermofilum pendens TaxID=2269 RepID=A0A7C1PM53_THEPE
MVDDTYTIIVYSVQVSRELLEFVVQQLQRFFNARALLAGQLPLGEILEHFDEEREQLRADELIEKLKERLGVLPHQRVLVIVEGDGYVEGLNFVFGVAAECWGGIVFTRRLYPEFYGGAPNETLLRIRLLKEVLHELGHSYGLTHCANNCVMRFSNSVFDVDSKNAFYCSRCIRELSALAPGLLRV